MPHSSPLRVLHLPKWYPHRYDDQDGDFVARHVAAIAGTSTADAPLHAAVVFAAVARGPLPRLIDREVNLDGPVPTWRYYYRRRLTGLGPLDKLLKLLLWLECMRRGLAAVRRHWQGRGPDLVHAHIMLRPAALALWLKWTRGIPYLITENWTIFSPQNVHKLGRLRQRVAALLVRQAATFTPVSDDLRRSLARLGGVAPRTVIIPNVVDTELFHLPTAPAGPRRGLLNVAAFNEQAKNLSGLLRTLARLRQSHPGLPDLHLRIAGYGRAEAEMQQLAADLGLLADGTVEFLGKLPSAGVAAEMQRAKAFVLFSNYENLPCVLIEAQASGLPAVATSVNGVPELVPPDCGLLVPPRDEAALAQALLAVLEAPPTRFAPEALRRRAEQQYSYPAVGAAFRRVYRLILGQPE
jgi:glycosyltransferase involved in cell wall biosynthesis